MKMTVRQKIEIARVGVTYGALVYLAYRAGLQHPAIAVIPLSIMIWEWFDYGRQRWKVRRYGQEIAAYHAEMEARQITLATQGNLHFDHLLQAAHRVFPKSTTEPLPLKLVIFQESSSNPESPGILKDPINGYNVLYPQGLLGLSVPAKQFILAHEITHYCLRNSWHHIFPRALFWISSLAAVATALLPIHFGQLSLIAFAASWVASSFLVHAVSRYKERRTDEGAARIVLELEWEQQQRQRDVDWGNVVAQTFEALFPKIIRYLHFRGVPFGLGLGSVSFRDSHPPAVTRAKAVRQRVARFRQMQAKALTARQKFLERCRLKGRRCECGSGEWAGACCGRMPTFNLTPWRS